MKAKRCTPNPISTRAAMLCILPLLSGCATKRIAEVQRVPPAPAFDGQGIVIVSITHEPSKDADMCRSTFYLSGADKRHVAYLFYDSDISDFFPECGRVFAFRLPPGSYTISNWGVSWDYRRRVRWDVLGVTRETAKDMAVGLAGGAYRTHNQGSLERRFRVRENELVYIGRLRVMLATYLDGYGYKFCTDGTASFAQRREEDIAAFRFQYPFFKELPITNGLME